MSKGEDKGEFSMNHGWEINFSDVFIAIKNQMRTVVLTMLVTVVLSIIYLNVVKHKYTIAMSVVSTATQGSSASKSLGGLAAMAGVSIPSSRENVDFDLYKASFYSTEVARAVLEDNELVSALFPNLWDKENKKWIRKNGIVQLIGIVVKPILGMYDNSIPPPEATMKLMLEEMIDISSTKTSPIVTISLLHANREKGIMLLKRLHSIADGLIRKRELQRTEEYISYLKGQLEAEKILEYQFVLTQLLAEQEQRRMVANTTLSYSAEVFAAPFSSARPTNPKPLLVVFLAIFLGLIFGVLFAMVRDQVHKR